MIELFGGIVGGLGLFMVGMWLLTENLRTLASRRLRRTAHRWTDDTTSWDIAKRLTGDRGAMMRKLRLHYLDLDPPLRNSELIDVLLITNSVEEAFFLMSKIALEFHPSSGMEELIPHA